MTLLYLAVARVSQGGGLSTNEQHCPSRSMSIIYIGAAAGELHICLVMHDSILCHTHTLGANCEIEKLVS